MYAQQSRPMREGEEALLSPILEGAARTKCSCTWRSRFTLAALRVVLWRCLAFTRPSFLRKQSPASGSEKYGEASRKPHSTEYLDGVRGVASLIVFILHWSHIPYPAVNSGWGYKDNTSFWLLPFVRIVYSGAAMVSIFFVVSGFVLSHRFIQRMHRQEYTELFASLTSLTFRRAIRLFLPAFASSTLAFVCAYLGIVNVPRKVNGRPFEHGVASYLEYLDLESNPWDWSTNFSGFYNPQLWSIAVEFRGSMVVFLLVLGLAKTRTSVRLAVETLLITHCFTHKRWDVALFIAGMAVAELEVLLRKPKNPNPRRIINVLLVLAMVLGLFLCGYPRDHNTQTPGYQWSKYVWPFSAYRRRFWLSFGAMLVVGPMAFLPSVQSVFLTRPVRYLGRISFALYLVHGLGNRTVGKLLLNGCWNYIGKEGFWPYTTSFIVSTTLYFPIVLWASDIFWRGVDIPSTNFARWFEKKCAAGEGGR
ncbi:acyltransferase family-domain-containing protein [Durotheca rogersii]|uniref:acyltransferase family-domain-containing protein n=1 Tax=Durotheca rogersii TaxID=419775 RepID=UPI00221FE932|nr:acyltransferase family-domain-containing protein [Durotheca rogersii]KAI5860617.1 acyltransferase family-domain-containing protein [Durotheca rogersii]